MSDYINIDMQIEIMKRLPIESLFRFRSVSKEWKFVIDSSHFAKAYNICQARPDHPFVSYNTRVYKSACAIITNHDAFPKQKFFHELPKCVETSIAESITVGCDHGLVCFSGLYLHAREWKKMYVLWNPSLGKLVAIDSPTSRSDSYAVAGFAVCPRTSDPKLVRIEDLSMVAESDYIASNNSTYVQVFTLSSGVWRSPYKNLPRRSISMSGSNIALDGFIYWLACDRVNRNSQGYNLIISFNLTSEVFEEVNLPDSLAHQGRTTLSISKLRGSLVVLQQTDEDKREVNVVWMMEPGVSKSFKKLFTIMEPYASIDYEVLGFSKNGETIMETHTMEAAGLEAYEVFSRHRKDLGISGIRGSFSMTSYMESLLLRDESASKDITAKL